MSFWNIKYKHVLDISKFRILFSTMSDTATPLNALRDAFQAGVSSVLPTVLVPKYVTRDGHRLLIGKTVHNLNSNVYVVGFGKAVISMVRPIEDALQNSDGSSHLVRGAISVPLLIRDSIHDCSLLPSKLSRVRVFEGAKNNLPDEDAHFAAQSIVSVIENLTQTDLLIILISGGGSALLPMPTSPITMLEKLELVKQLGSAGATIVEMNTVRKALSDVKGGNLAHKTKAKIVTLILSDTIGSPLDIIASGPTVPNEDKPGAAIAILNRFKIEPPQSVIQVLSNYVPIKGNDLLHVTNYIIGDNSIALNAALFSAQNTFTENCCCLAVTDSLQGNSLNVGKSIAVLSQIVLAGYKTGRLKGYKKCSGDSEAIEDFSGKDSEASGSDVPAISKSLLESLHVRQEATFLRHLASCVANKRPCCLLFGGETTVKVTGTGTGGRNQEMVLAFSIYLEALLGTSEDTGTVVFLSAGTDGIDGPTDAAGAATYWTTARSLYKDAIKEGLRPEAFLSNNDSNTFFRSLESGKYLLSPGHTATNVMDLQLLYISP